MYRDELKIKKIRARVYKVVLVLMILVAALIGTGYFLFLADLFNVRTISINASADLRGGIENEVNSWLAAGFWKINRRNNVLFFSARKLSGYLLSQLQSLDSAEVVKRFPHTLEISVVERKPVGIWCVAGKQCFYFDKAGAAYLEAVPSSGFIILNVNDERTRDLNIGSPVADRDLLDGIVLSRSLLSKNNIKVGEFIVPADSFDDFYAKTAGGWQIKFSSSTDVAKQIRALTVFLNNKLTSAQKSALQYIDLRIQDRIYYK